MKEVDVRDMGWDMSKYVDGILQRLGGKAVGTNITLLDDVSVPPIYLR